MEKTLITPVTMFGLHNVPRDFSIYTRAHFQGKEDYDSHNFLKLENGRIA